MLLTFATILAGIIIGVGGAALFIAFRECSFWDDEPNIDLADVMVDIQPDGTPFLSEIERHRQAHLASRGGRGGGNAETGTIGT